MKAAGWRESLDGGLLLGTRKLLLGVMKVVKVKKAEESHGQEHGLRSCTAWVSAPASTLPSARSWFCVREQFRVLKEFRSIQNPELLTKEGALEWEHRGHWVPGGKQLRVRGSHLTSLSPFPTCKTVQ